MSHKNIVIIGSLSQAEIFDRLEQKYKLQGDDVWRPTRQPDRPFEDLVKECFEKISEADEIIAVQKPDGTFGEGTTYEMIFAIFYHGKNVEIYNSNKDSIMRKKWEEDL